ncbi:MAG TPA: amino acid permease [Abditibacteriaceae bacterium]|nr:amino acid permease [Abditibacteriaceae bacterium]
MQASAQPIANAGEPPRLERHNVLSVTDAVAIMVGVVIGAGIFKTPSLVAANTGSESGVLLAWLLGGVISLVGALCYAELATAYPSKGGEYHFLTRAFGNNPAFLFAWARLAIIQTGSIAMLAFVIGDYATQVVNLGAYSSSLYAALAIMLLTMINVFGFRQSKWTQNLLSGAILLGLLSVVIAGIVVAAPAAATTASSATPTANPQAAFGMAMILVLLTYGGWNEAAYLSTEVHQPRRNMVRALLWGIAVITTIYVLVNIAFFRVLGLEGMAKSEVVAADLMRNVAGEGGARFISLLITVAALSTINGTMFTGARTNFALGRDFALFSFLGQWREKAGTPANALLVQGAVALALVLLGTMTRQGFSTMVDYTAPVFWFFFLLVGVALLVLRRREPNAERPFRVPLYPLTPLLFCIVCVYMLRSSVAYTGIGALVGVGVMLAGVPLLLWARRRTPQEAASAENTMFKGAE